MAFFGLFKDEKTIYCIVFSFLLALQFSLQSLLTNRFTAKGVSKPSFIIGTELAKIFFASLMFLIFDRKEIPKIRESWTITNSFTIAAIPSILFAIQNLCIQYGYMNLDSMTFNLLNQTKTLSTAFSLWLVLGIKQSYMQVFALLLIVVASILLTVEFDSTSTSTIKYTDNYKLGLMAVGVASLLSGINAALGQKAMQGLKPRNALFLSAELAFYVIIYMLVTLNLSNDLQGTTLFANWDVYTLIPVITQALGGIVVGQLTKYGGGIVKGFALIVGIIFTGVVSMVFEGKPLEGKDFIAIVLVCLSIYLHSSFPYIKLPTITTDEKSKESKQD